MVDHSSKANMGASSDLAMNAAVEENVEVTSNYLFECYDRHGNLKWVEETQNLVVTVGLNELLDKTFKASAYTASWFVGLKGAGAVIASDTMASQTNWSELTPYSNATRPALTLGAVASGSVDNSASKASFNINATATIVGAFTVNNNTKGGTAGVLYGAADFGASRAVLDGDTLNVTVTLTVAAA